MGPTELCASFKEAHALWLADGECPGHTIRDVVKAVLDMVRYWRGGTWACGAVAGPVCG